MAIHQFIRKVEAGEPLQMFGDGSTSRDYTFVDDIVDGIEAALFKSEGYRIYNLGESKTITLRDLIALIGRHVGRAPQIEHRPLQPGDVTRTFADVTRARAELGYDPKVNIDEGIRRMVEWYRADRAASGT
jgi:UDP-glucuronate 4-epimerase